MSKPIYTVEQILNMDLPPIIIYAAPIMIVLTLMEYAVRVYRMGKSYDGKDAFAAFAVGVGNIITSALFKALLFGLILFFYNLVPWYLPHAWYSYVIAFFAIDFCRYWAHRVAHEQRFWWATHVTHHSSEQYTFTVGFRLSWVQHIKVIFYIPVALLGVDPFVFFICNQIAVLYQFWIHTELINKMPRPIEWFFVTPSHHRVHHATNDKYLDRNYGSTFIIWDRMFGTFQPEEETPDYGILKPVNSYNPVYLVFHEFIDIFRDLSRYRNFRAWKRILFGSPSLVLDKEKAYGFEKEGGKDLQEPALEAEQIKE